MTKEPTLGHVFLGRRIWDGSHALLGKQEAPKTLGSGGFPSMPPSWQQHSLPIWGHFSYRATLIHMSSAPGGGGISSESWDAVSAQSVCLPGSRTEPGLET